MTVAIPRSRSRLSISPEYCVIGAGSPARERRGEGAIIGRTQHCSRPITGSHRRLQTINIAGSGAPKTAGEGMGGARPGKRNGHRPPDDGPGNHHLPPLPVGRRWTIGRRRGRDGRVKRPGLRRRGAPVKKQTCSAMEGCDCRPDTGYGRQQTRRRTWPYDRPTLRAVGTFDVCSNAAVNSDLSCFLYTL